MELAYINHVFNHVNRRGTVYCLEELRSQLGGVGDWTEVAPQSPGVSGPGCWRPPLCVCMCALWGLGCWLPKCVCVCVCVCVCARARSLRPQAAGSHVSLYAVVIYWNSCSQSVFQKEVSWRLQHLPLIHESWQCLALPCQFCILWFCLGFRVILLSYTYQEFIRHENFSTSFKMITLRAFQTSIWYNWRVTLPPTFHAFRKINSV